MTPGRTVEMKSAWPGSTPKLPSLPGTTTMSTASDSNSRSGETSSNCTLSAMFLPRSPCFAPCGGGPHPSPNLSPLPNGRGEREEEGLRRFGRHLAGLLDGLLDGADHVEGGFGEVVVVAGDDPLEALDRVLERDELARAAGKDLGDV